MPVRKTKRPPITTWNTAEGGGEQGRQGRDRAVHQPGQAGLDHLEYEQALPRGRLLFGRPGGALGALQLLGEQRVLALLLGQVAQELPDACVAALPGGGLVE